MWRLESTEDIVHAHGIWFGEVGNIGYRDQVRVGHVILTDTGGSGEVGFWGSSNSLGMVAKGAVGIVTDGYCRDRGEIVLQKTLICAGVRGRTIIPGRIEVAEVQVRLGDIVGCDDDGVVVPLEVAGEVAVHARAILLADMRARGGHYERLGMEMGETVDWETVEAYYR